MKKAQQKVNKIFEKKIKGDLPKVSGVPLRSWVRHAPAYDDENFPNLDKTQFFRMGNGPIRHTAKAMGWTEKNVQNWMFKAVDGRTHGRIPELKRLRNYFLAYEQGTGPFTEKVLANRLDKLEVLLSTKNTSRLADLLSLPSSARKMDAVMLASVTFSIPEWLRLCLDAGVEPPMDHFPHGITLLHRAANLGNTRCARLLIESGSDVDATDDDGETPVMTAVYNDNVETVRLLLENGASTDRKTVMGLTLSEMANGKTAEIVENYDNRDRRDTEVSLRDVIEEDLHEEILTFTDAKSITDVESDRGYSPAHIAAELGHSKALEYFLDEGISPDVQAPNQFTPLHLAAQEGNPEAVNILVARGAVVDIEAGHGLTPLTLASQSSNKGTDAAYYALLRGGASVEKALRIEGLEDLQSQTIFFFGQIASAVAGASAEDRLEAKYRSRLKDISQRLKNSRDPSDYLECTKDLLSLGDENPSLMPILNVIVQFIKNNYTDDTRELDITEKVNLLYKQDGFFNYILLDASEGVARIVKKMLEDSGFYCPTWGKTNSRLSDDGRFKWYIRLDSPETGDPGFGSIKDALSPLQGLGLRFQSINSSVGEKEQAAAQELEDQNRESEVQTDLIKKVRQLRKDNENLRNKLRRAYDERDRIELDFKARKADLLGRIAALEDRIVEYREGRGQDNDLKNLKEELQYTRRELEEAKKEFGEFREVLKREKADLEERLESLEKQVVDIRNDRDVARAELEDKRKKVQTLSRQIRNAESMQKETNLSEGALRSAFELLFPNIILKRGSASFIANEIVDTSDIMSKLAAICKDSTALQGKQVKGTDDWLEVHYTNGQSDAGRMYYKKTERGGMLVLVSHKDAQGRDVKYMKEV